MVRFLPLLLMALASCTPRLAPLYRDFSTEGSGTETLERAAHALGAAGWELTEPPAPGVLATHPRKMSDWGLYQVYLHVEVLPLGGDYVRLLFHPYRQYVTGGRGKIPYVPAGVLHRAAIPLGKAFEAYGFEAVTSGERAYRTGRAGTRGE